MFLKLNRLVLSIASRALYIYILHCVVRTNINHATYLQPTQHRRRKRGLEDGSVSTSNRNSNRAVKALNDLTRCPNSLELISCSNEFLDKGKSFYSKSSSSFYCKGN